MNNQPSFVNGEPNSNDGARGTETTGKLLVLLNEDAMDSAAEVLSTAFGTSVAHAADFASSAVDYETLTGDAPLILDELGVAVVPAEHEGSVMLASDAGPDSPILAVEPERVVYALADPVLDVEEEDAVEVSGDYQRGFDDGIAAGLRTLGGMKMVRPPEEEIEAEAVWNETLFTWGLQAIRANLSRRSGLRVPIAVLDTGLDLRHPDFSGRSIRSQSFVPGQGVQDGHGHGTHCTGTAAGTARVGIRPRYGVAFRSNIFSGKVLDNAGRGMDSWILAGIEWALRSRCRVISMSLGARVAPGEPPSAVYEMVARRALDANTLIIAAAGNDSNRAARRINPVSRPANSPSIMAVASLDTNLRVSNFSNGGTNPAGGEVNIAAPGETVHSSWPMPTRYRRLNGTSMATPHVAGAAAMLMEANPGVSAREIWRLLLRTARRLPLPARDVGAGLVQCP